MLKKTSKEIFVTAIVAGTVVPTMIVGTAVPTRAVGTVVPTKVVGTAAKEILFLQSLLGQLFPQ